MPPKQVNLNSGLIQGPGQNGGPPGNSFGPPPEVDPLEVTALLFSSTFMLFTLDGIPWLVVMDEACGSLLSDG